MPQIKDHRWQMQNMADRIAQCYAKVPFATKGDAMKYADRHAIAANQRSYRCDICGQWHLTKKVG